MIVSWQHKGLKKFFETESKAGICAEHAKRLKVLLQLLNAAKGAEQMNLPGLDFHKLIGNKKGFYSIAVRANWKIIFKFDGENAVLVDYLDYH
jgi:toxin HigB-1